MNAHGKFAKVWAVLLKEAQDWCFILGTIFLPAAVLTVYVDHHYHHGIFTPGSQENEAVAFLIIWAAVAIVLGAVSWPRREKRRSAIIGMACAAAGLAVILFWNYLVTNPGAVTQFPYLQTL